MDTVMLADSRCTLEYAHQQVTISPASSAFQVSERSMEQRYCIMNFEFRDVLMMDNA